MGEDICTLFYLVINTWKYFNGIPNICSIKISRVLGYGHSTDFLSGWSTEGVRTVSTGGNETHCYTTHLTSFAVMLVNRNFVLYSITVEYCIFIFTLYKSGLALKKTPKFWRKTGYHARMFYTLLLCRDIQDPTPTHMLPDSHEKALTYISYIGCAISIFGLAFTIITYSMFR